MEHLWVAFTFLCVINFILFALIGFLMHRIAKLETLLSDPDDFANMMRNLEIEASYRARQRRDEHNHSLIVVDGPLTNHEYRNLQM